MLIKLIGGFLIVAGCAFVGFLKADELSKREHSLMNLKTAFNLLEGEIMYSSSQLKFAFERVSRLSGCGELFLSASEKILDMGASDGWRCAVSETKELLGLKETDREILDIFAAGLGVSDREQQVKNIRHISSLLEDALKDASAEYDKSAKVYRSMGLLGGLFVFIMLL